VDPVPDPLLLFSGSAGNRTRASGSIAKNSEMIRHSRIYCKYETGRVSEEVDRGQCGNEGGICLPV
jgi:hypothetical protein